MNHICHKGGLLSKFLLLAISFSFVGSTVWASSGKTRPLAIENVAVGIKGYYKVAEWTPLTVTVTTSKPLNVRLLVEAPDAQGSPTVLPGPKTSLSSPGSHQLRTYFKTGRINSRITVRIQSEQETLATRVLKTSQTPDSELRPALRQSTLLWATLGNPAGLENFDSERESNSPSSRSETEEQPSVIVVPLESSQQLPSDGQGYQALDAVIVADLYTFNARQSQALRDWVERGGHLVLAVGSRASEYQKSRLASWVPITVKDTTTIGDLSGLESFSGKNVRIPFFQRVDGALLEVKDGKILVSSRDGPLLVRSPYAFGRVTFLALDLNNPPLSQWESLATVISKILDTNGQFNGNNQQSSSRRKLSHSGITDLASQLHLIQEKFPDVRRLSTWTIMGLMVLYLLLIGPVDYLLVHRLLKKPKLTWLTFPTMVLLATLTAVWGAQRTNTKEAYVNQLDLVDIDVASGNTRSQSWLTLYSPQSTRYQVAVQPLNVRWKKTQAEDGQESNKNHSSKSVQPRVTWFGIPEETFGGMYRKSGLEMGRPAYRFMHQGAAIENLPIPIWSTRNLTAQWNHEQKLVESSLTSTSSGQLSGTLSHQLPGPLEDWVLAFGNSVYRPRNDSQASQIPPDQPWSPNNPAVQVRELRGYLTGARRTRVEQEQSRDPETRIEKKIYDPLNRDIDDYAKMLTFHEAAGGKNYTGLDNQSLDRFDFSNMLTLNRAVLFAKFKAPAAGVQINGESIKPTKQDTFVRIVLPVKEAGSVRKEIPKFEGNRQ